MAPFDLSPATPEDIPAIVALCARALGWRAGEPNEALFRWKHFENPFGSSFVWLARSGGRLVGVRPMMQWQLVRADGRSARAVRAVDTATDPEFQGRGVFRTLTQLAVDELTSAGVDFVFNTPNAQSRPGYLKLGWHDVGRVAIVVRPTRWRHATRLVGARVPAAKWSEPPIVGQPPEAVEDPPRSARWRTRVDPAFVAWRYRFPELAYRAVGAGDAQAIFRVRRRGRAREATLADVVGADHGAARRAVRGLRRSVVADYVLATKGTPGTSGFLPVPSLGPRLVVRPLAGPAPSLAELDLRMSDIELF